MQYILHYLGARAVWHFLGHAAPLIGLVVLLCLGLTWLAGWAYSRRSSR